MLTKSRRALAASALALAAAGGSVAVIRAISPSGMVVSPSAMPSLAGPAATASVPDGAGRAEGARAAGAVTPGGQGPGGAGIAPLARSAGQGDPGPLPAGAVPADGAVPGASPVIQAQAAARAAVTALPHSPQLLARLADTAGTGGTAGTAATAGTAGAGDGSPSPAAPAVTASRPGTGTPEAATPTTAAPTTAAPTTAAPTSGTGTPTTGTPTSGTGTPATGTPATGTPATGTPATGTGSPATGTPATGTPATGTPATGTGSPGTGTPAASGTSSPTSPGTAAPASPGTPTVLTSPASSPAPAKPTPRPSASPAPVKPPRRLPGLDVAAFQHPRGAAISWGTVARAGYKYAAVKATEGDYYVNPYAAGDLKSAKAAGLDVAPYHFAIPNASGGAAQAQFAVEYSGYVAGARMLPLMLDIEYDPYVSTDHTNECYGLSAARMTAWLAAFVAEARTLTGQYPVIYTTADWWDTCTGRSAAFGADPMWIAAYGFTSPPMPPGWKTWTFWQYSSSGTVPGVATAGGTDIDTFSPAMVGLISPGGQSARCGAPVSLTVASLGALAGEVLAYSAAGLPPGLSAGQGAAIAGTIAAAAAPKTPVTYRVTLTVRNAAGATATAVFTWKVSPA